MELISTIGLEIHVELKTKTKMFCGCLNDSDEKHPNINVCPICMAHPGTLPVINKEAVKSVLKTGLALGGKPASYSQFDRKNYFYPDLPKGYQISQYKHPLVEEGELNGIRITRIHLEEDTGRLIHQGEESLVDFNRAGVPLMELVTEPDITSGKDAKAFCEELQLILRYLGVSSADMEKGQMRCEVNISLNMGLNPADNSAGSPEHFAKQNVLGTKVEIKNLNSFKAVEKAIDYETERQKEIIKEGGKIEQETRGWDETKQKTFSQRKKEEAHDYRYFPEPDLPSLDLERYDLLSEIVSPIELPQQKRERFKKEYKLKDNQIEILVRDKKLSDFFESTISELKVEIDCQPTTVVGSLAELVFNYLNSDLVGLMNKKYLNWGELRVSSHSFGELMAMIIRQKISSAAAKDVLRKMFETGKDAGIIVQEEGLEQTSDTEFIEKAVKQVIAKNPKPVNDYKNGKQEVLQFLIGQAMKETRGKSNPAVLKEVFEQILDRDL